VPTNAELRLRWFDAGAAALERLTGGAVTGRYACPLCRRVFPKVGVADGTVLTLEDVPPKAVTGKRRPLVLTCKNCNNEHGSSLDAHAEREARMSRALGGQLAPNERVNTRLTSDDVEIPAELTHGPQGEWLFHLDVDRAPPGSVHRFMDSLTATTGSEPRSFGIQTAEPWNTRGAFLSWVRAAYLAGFAVMGYRWILSNPDLERLRKQLRDPTTNLADIPVFEVGASSGQRSIIRIAEPKALAGSMAVIIGRVCVVLPGPHPLGVASRWSFENALGVLSEASGVLANEEVEWPTGPLHATDSYPDPEVFVHTG
jgi:hypothetical protein